MEIEIMSKKLDGVLLPPDPPELRLGTLGGPAASFTELAPEALTSRREGFADEQLYNGTTIPIPGPHDPLPLDNGVTIPVP